MSSLKKLKKRSLYLLGIMMSLLLSYVIKDTSDDPEKITDGFAFPEAHADFRSPSGGGCSGGDGDDMEGTGSDAGGSTGGGDGGCGCDGGCSGGSDAGDAGSDGGSDGI